MSYLNEYTFGAKTTAQIASLTGMSAGDSVFNTDIKREEYYTGAVWTNDDCVVLLNGHGATSMSEGEVVYITSAADLSCRKAILTDDYRTAGVVFRGGSAGATVVIAIQGTYSVLYNTNTTRGHYSILTITEGQAADTLVVAPGVIGLIMENKTIVGTGLAKTFLQIAERF